MATVDGELKVEGGLVVAEGARIVSGLSAPLTMYAVSNTTQSTSGTLNASNISFAGAGIASVGVSNGSVLISVPAGGGAGMSMGMSTQGNTSGTTGLVSNQYLLVGGNNITLSQSVNGQSATLTISAGAGGGGMALSAGTQSVSTGTVVFSNSNGYSFGMSGSSQITVAEQHRSSWHNLEGPRLASAITTGSVSYAVSFYLPNDMSISYIRMPVFISTGSTTLATLASATATASASVMSTYNAVVYSMGVGANSRSLQSVASGSVGFTWRNSISITNSTQYSITQQFSAHQFGVGTTITTQYSISNTNYSFVSTLLHSQNSNVRFIDIPFATSLSAGPYWMIYGFSSSSASAGAVAAGISACRLFNSNHYMGSYNMPDQGFFGLTDRSSGGWGGAAQFSTAGGGTTASLNRSALTAHSNILYFQFVREA